MMHLCLAMKLWTSYKKCSGRW